MSSEYSHTLASDPTVIEALFERGDGGVAFQYFPAATLVWLLALWLARAGLRYFFASDEFKLFVARRVATGAANEDAKALIARHGPSDEQLDALITWILELVITSVAVVVTYSMAGHILVHGSYHDRTGGAAARACGDWGQPPAWVLNAEGAMTAWTWGAQPVVLLYLFEVVAASQLRERTPQHHLLTLHHLMAVGQLALMLKATATTLNGRWSQMLLVMFLHMVLEQPIFCSLVAYRLRLPHWRALVFGSVVYELFLRLALWSACTFVYVELCWLSSTFTAYEVVYRWLYPVLMLFMAAAQAQVVLIHVAIARAKPRGEGRQSSVDSEQGEDHPAASDSSGKGSGQSKRHGRPVTKLMMWLVTVVAIAAVTAVVAVFFGAEVGRGSGAALEIRHRRVAVVGGGVAGLGTAFALAREPRFSVTVLEAAPRFGGAARSVSRAGLAIDHAFHAFRDYHNFEALLRSLSVASDLASSGMTVHLSTGNESVLDYTGPAGIASRSWLEARPTEVVDLQEELTREASRLEAALSHAAATWSTEELMTVTLGELLAQEGLSQDFIEFYLEACLKIYVASSGALLDMPVGFVRFLERTFQLCVAQGRVTYRYVRDGASTYVQRLEEELRQKGVRMVANARAEALQLHGGGKGRHVLQWRDVVSGHMAQEAFDHVVFATPQDVTWSVLSHHDSSTLTEAELERYRDALGAGRYPRVYSNYTTVVHNDAAMVERRLAAMRDAAGCLNAEIYGILGAQRADYDAATRRSPKGRRFDVMSFTLPGSSIFSTACVRRLEPLLRDAYAMGGVTGHEQPTSVIETAEWRPFVHDVPFYRGARCLHELQGLHRLWFAGGEAAGANLHEHAFTSGLVIAHALGAPYPFEGNHLARSWFLRMRAWLLYGLSPMVNPSTPPERSLKRCKRCF